MQRFDIILLATMVMVAAIVFNRCDQPAHSEQLKPPVPEGITLEADTARVQGTAVIRTGPSGRLLIETVEAPEEYRRWLEQNEFEFEYAMIDSSLGGRVDSLDSGALVVRGELVYGNEKEERNNPAKRVTPGLKLI